MARRQTLRILLAASAASIALPANAASDARAASGLLFSLSGEHGLEAEQAGGGGVPIFARGARAIADGARGSALSLDHDLVLAWPAPGNIYAKRGTISFFFRARDAYGRTPFPIFRVGAAEGSSWDMAWLRIDWNGAGFDAFVTDTNLARTRASYRLGAAPDPAAWTHIAFAWDEAEGVVLWIDAKRVAEVKRRALYDQGLFGFGPFQRIVSPYQVQSAYNFRRGGDLDELRIHDRRLTDAEVAALAAGSPLTPPAPRATGDDALWRLRHGWTGPQPPPLDAPVTRIRRVEFTDTRDIRQRMFRGADGIRETTWPGVYNRSRLPGRHDYFELPDWNVYSQGGKAYRLTLPDEPWNRIEIVGAASGTLARIDGDAPGLLLRRGDGVERSSTQLPRERRGGTIRFDNRIQETPIQEISAYHVGPGAVPEGIATLSYAVDPGVDPAAYPTLTPLTRFIAGRFVAEERAGVVALPAGAPRVPRPAAGVAGRPVVHILVPADFRDPPTGGAPSRYSYGWKNIHAGLDGIALELPALAVGTAPVPLNIRVKDPLWPERDMLDVNVSVRPGAARTLWLDLRDRILPDDASLWLSIASAGRSFTPEALAGMRLRLVFKDFDQAKTEHVADRFEQARDNLAFFVEEQPGNRLYPLWERFERDISDLLRVDSANALARSYWVDRNPEQSYAPLPPLAVPVGVPAWAFWQSEELKLYRRFVDWWIDQRQIANGEFGGGLSDDTDLVNQWVPLALMGVMPDRLIASQRRVLDATYANGMWSGGLSRIRTDELHSYEEGINAVGQAMQLSWGDPSAIERGMAVAREYARLVEVNPAGHSHVTSAYFSGTDIHREGTLGWQRPYGFLIFHPGLLLAAYNGAPGTRALILALLDGWLAHADRDGRLPAEIEWATDRTRGSGTAAAAHMFWAAWSWTGDARYLRPIEAEIGRGNLPALTALNADLLARMPGGSALAARIAGGEAAPSGATIDRNLGGAPDRDFARFVRWQRSGDNRIVADLFAAEAEADRQRMHLLTDGHLWSDRVSVPNELLQRARLGGVAHRRNAYFPGNLVSWRFAAPAQGEDVAILIPQGDPRRFRVIAHNLSDRPVSAEMIGAELAPGRWTVTEGIDADGDSRADIASPERTLTLERGLGATLALPPRQTVVFEFALDQPGDDPATRADIGLSADDLTLAGNRLHLRVHSLGALPTPPGTAIAEDEAGRELARARFPGLAAPIDLRPKTADLALRLPGATAGQAIRIRLMLEGAPAEVTQRNNQAILGDILASQERLARR